MLTESVNGFLPVAINVNYALSKKVVHYRAVIDKAKALLEKAKRAVEIAIEENEEQATEFIG